MASSPGIRLSFCAAAAALWASPALGADSAPLPLTRVRLYETGVGYFERSGPLAPRGVGLAVPASHLDDALKTLVVLSDDPGAHVGGIEFSSSLSPGRARSLAGLPGLEDGTPLGLSALLRGLRGEKVEVRARGASITGRLVEVLDAEHGELATCVEKSERLDGAPATCAPTKYATLVVLGASGEIRRVRVDDVESVRPTEPELVRRLAAALDAASDRNARSVKELRLRARGKNVTLGYVSETPVWRASYRLVLGASKSAKIQGYALIHNDTDEPWRGVRVELVNGRPDSFLFPLAAPRYARRELVTPNEQLSTQPQLGATTADQMWGDEVGEAYGVGGLGLSGVGEGGGGRGEGIGLGSIGTLGHGAGTGDASDLLALGNLAGVSSAAGVEAGALFRFTLAEPVELRAHGSALAPFVSEAIEAVRVASFESVGSGARSAVRVTHRGTQTLPAGTIAVFDDGGFAGESVLARTKPNETELVVFGNDLDVTLAESEHRETDEPRLLSYEPGVLVEHFVRRHALRYDIENRSGSEREIALALSFVNNTKVEGADALFFDAPSRRAFASFALKAKSSSARAITASEGLERRHDLTSLTLETLERLSGRASLPAKQRAVVAEALAFARGRNAAQRNRLGWQAVLNERNAEVERLRANARAVGQAASEEIVERLLEIEAETKTIRRHVAAFAARAKLLNARQTEALARL